MDKQRLARDDRSFKCLHILTAAFCEPLQDYQTMAIMDRLLERAALEGGCQHFGPATDQDGVSVYHNHPRFRNTPPPATKAYAVRHSPYPSFSVAAHYSTGGGAQARWPLPPVGQDSPVDTTLQPLRRLAPRPMQPDRTAASGHNGGSSSAGTPQTSRPDASQRKKPAPRPDRWVALLHSDEHCIRLKGLRRQLHLHIAATLQSCMLQVRFLWHNNFKSR